MRQGGDYWIKHVPRREMVWRSDIVTWKAEWRFYVVCGQIKAKAFYHGDESVMPDTAVVHEAVERLKEVKGFPRHYAIDFGVLDNGKTALVECNDGFAIGAYEGVPQGVYFEMLRGRWNELMAYQKETADAFPSQC